MPTGLDSVGRMEFSCLQHSFLCSFCSFLVILSTPTSITLTPVCHSSLPLDSGDLQSSHWKIAALCTTDRPSLLRKNYFKCHGRFSPVRYRLACLQFYRSSWNASCPGHGEKGSPLWQLESSAWTGTCSVLTSYGTFSVQVKWWLLRVFNLMTEWLKEKGMSQHFYFIK